MKIWIAIAVLLLCEPKVQCDQQLLCSPREPPSGVLALHVGSEVALGCRGDITVDGVPKQAAPKANERPRTRGDTTVHRTSSKPKESPSVSEKHFGNVTSSLNATRYKRSADVITLAVSTSKPPVITTREGQETDHNVNQPTQFNREGGGALRMTTSETSESMEWDDYDDFEEPKNGARVTRSVRRRARWTRNGQPVQRLVEKGGVLRFPNIQVANSGNYSCYRGDRLVSSVKLSVGVGPVSPSLQCYKKSHISKIRCEWISRQPIVPRPQCSLLLTKGLAFSRMDCSYSPERSRCWCAFSCDEGESDTYGARLCVSNNVGSALSPTLMFTSSEILKPDCPSHVTVWPVEGAPHTLRVAWNLPRTWKQSSFYKLIFCLRYRPTQATEFQEVPDRRGEFFYLISDALSRTEYEIQVKAKDDFDGVWSDWSSPVYGQSWTALVPTPFDILGSLEPSYEEGSGEPVEDPDPGLNPAADGALWVVVWVVGPCLFISMVTIITVCLFRHRSPFISKKLISPSCSYSSPPQSPAPLVVPQQQSPHYFMSGPNEESEGIYLHNVDYFFSSYRLDSSAS